MNDTKIKTITLQHHGLERRATVANDVSPDDAVDIGRELLAQGVTFNAALVDRTDGTMLFGPHGVLHFETLRCRKGENHPHTAEVLAMFRFGTMSDLMTQLRAGSAVTIGEFYPLPPSN